jgi:hypothetical protein
MPIQEVDPSPSGEIPQAEEETLDETLRGGPEAIGRLERQFEELLEYFRLYAAARGDALWASLRRLGVRLAAGAVMLVVLLATVATAAVIAILGLAQLVGQALGERLWAGYVATGVGLLAILAVALAIGMMVMRRRFRSSTVKKYARRHRQHEARFGRDAARQSQRV